MDEYDCGGEYDLNAFLTFAIPEGITDVLGTQTLELLYKIQLRLGAPRARSCSLGTRRWKWGQGEGAVEGENSSLSDGPAGSAAESRVRQKSLSQPPGAKEQSGQ